MGTTKGAFSYKEIRKSIMKNQYIFNIGFSNSGTTSLTDALNILGFPSIHCTTDNSVWSEDNKNLLENIIIKNISNNKKLFYPIDKKFIGFSDFKGERYFKDLYHQYPNSKFIFTTRNIENWIKSRVDLERILRPHNFNTIENEQKLIHRLITSYYRNMQEITNFFKNKEHIFLKIDICNGEGWNKLCKFLNVNIPKVSFPHHNKNNSKNNNMKKLYENKV